mgnify:CR=1 FL=1
MAAKGEGSWPQYAINRKVSNIRKCTLKDAEFGECRYLVARNTCHFFFGVCVCLFVFCFFGIYYDKGRHN